MRRIVRSGTGSFTSNNLKDGKYPREKLPLEERYSARHFTLDKVLEPVKIDNTVEIEDYHTIEDWASYVEYLSSDKILKYHASYLTRGKKLTKMCIDSEEIHDPTKD